MISHNTLYICIIICIYTNTVYTHVYIYIYIYVYTYIHRVLPHRNLCLSVDRHGREGHLHANNNNNNDNNDYDDIIIIIIIIIIIMIIVIIHSNNNNNNNNQNMNNNAQLLSTSETAPAFMLSAEIAPPLSCLGISNGTLERRYSRIMLSAEYEIIFGTLWFVCAGALLLPRSPATLPSLLSCFPALSLRKSDIYIYIYIYIYTYTHTLYIYIYIYIYICSLLDTVN